LTRRLQIEAYFAVEIITRGDKESINVTRKMRQEQVAVYSRNKIPSIQNGVRWKLASLENTVKSENVVVK